MIWTIYSMVIGTVIAIVWPGPWEILQLNPKIKNTHSSSYLEGFFNVFFLRYRQTFSPVSWYQMALAKKTPKKLNSDVFIHKSWSG